MITRSIPDTLQFCREALLACAHYSHKQTISAFCSKCSPVLMVAVVLRLADGEQTQKATNGAEIGTFYVCSGRRSRARDQDTTTASRAAEERFRDLRALAGRADPRHMPMARPIASLTHSEASWSSMWPAVGWCR
jgi:hypothetical protein